MGRGPAMLRHLDVPEAHQRIFQSHAAALEEAKRGNGVALALSFAVAGDLAQGRLVASAVMGSRAKAVWSTLTLRRTQRHAGGRRADPLRHHTAGHPGDAEREPA